MGGFPTFVILVPSDPASMHAAVKAATDYVGPVFLRSSRVAMPDIYPADDCPFEIGKANMVREGKDLTIVGCGIMVAIGPGCSGGTGRRGYRSPGYGHSHHPPDG